MLELSIPVNTCKNVQYTFRASLKGKSPSNAKSIYKDAFNFHFSVCAYKNSASFYNYSFELQALWRPLIAPIVLETSGERHSVSG